MPDNPLDAIPDYKSWLTPEQVGERLGVSSTVVNAWIVTGVRTETGRIHLRAAKIGGRWRIEPAAVVEFVNATTAVSLPPSATGAPPAPKVDTEAERKRRADACLARMRANGLLTDAVPGRRPNRRGKPDEN